MRKLICSGMYQTQKHKLYISVLSVIMVVYLGSAEVLLRTVQQRTLLPAGYHTAFMNNALESITSISFLPVIAALSFSGEYVDEVKSKFAIFCLIRINYEHYLWSCVLVCFLCGGAVILLGNLLSWGISALLFMPMEMAAEEGAVSTVSIWPILVQFF